MSELLQIIKDRQAKSRVPKLLSAIRQCPLVQYYSETVFGPEGGIYEIINSSALSEEMLDQIKQYFHKENVTYNLVEDTENARYYFEDTETHTEYRVWVTEYGRTEWVP